MATPGLLRSIRARAAGGVSLEEAILVQSLADKFLDTKEALLLSQTMFTIPIQNSIKTEEIVGIVLDDYTEEEVYESQDVRPSLLDSEDDRAVFPLKETVAANTKVNVFFRDCWSDVKDYFPVAASYLSRNPELLLGKYNDEATGWLIWFVGVFNLDQSVAVKILRKSGDYKLLGRLSDVLKASGRGDDLLGRACMETRNLAGRGAAAPDPDGDVEGRINKDFFDKNKSSGVGEEIRPYVRSVLFNEMQSRPKWDSPDEYWSKRWLYTKSGSHARRIEKEMYGEKLDLPSQPTRREFAEAVKENVVAAGEPMTVAGQSWKLEHYKTRAIYSGDTRSYYTFDYLLRPVEAVWANRSCLLDPGGRSQNELYSELSRRGGVNFMLDFEDYNSQHTKEAMKVVIEEACVGAPQEVLDWAVASIDNESICWRSGGEEKQAKTVGGLLSGHRATTFINTVLNEAYCRMAFGDVYDRLYCKHCGDDVIVQGTASDVGEAIESFFKTALRANKSKQGVGSFSGEFLRVSYNSKDAGGYFARAVASTVSGSWVSDVANDQSEMATNYANMAWTLRVRSQVNNIGAVLTSTFRRRVPLLASYAFAVVTNGVSVGGSPVLGTGKGEVVMLDLETPQRRMRVVDASKSFATDDFINTQVDRRILEISGLTRKQLRRAMLEVSTKPRVVVPESGSGKVLSMQAPLSDCIDITVVKHCSVVTETRTQIAAKKVLEGLYGRMDWNKVFSIVTGSPPTLVPELSRAVWPAVNAGNLSVAELAKAKNQLVRSARVTTAYPILV